MNSCLPKILITGGQGQLATALSQHRLAHAFQIKTCSHAEMDITDQTSIHNAINAFHPTIIINTAAYTAVDKAEQEREIAMQVNQVGASELALACEKHHIPLIHISTDYIFDGTKTSPYCEDDKAHPLNVYGESKWWGEQAVRKQCEQHIILRVSSVFGEYGSNFLKTILRLAEERTELRVIADQIACPTYTSDIAEALYTIAKKICTQKQFPLGTYHYCSAMPVSWYQFASTIVNEAKQYKVLALQEIKAIPAVEYRTAAKRPPYSVLDCHQLETVFGIAQPSWEWAVKNVVARLLSKTRV